MLDAFRNEPFTDFTDEKSRQSFEAALAKVSAELGREYAPIVGGVRAADGALTPSINPARASQVIGFVSQADQALAERAIQAAAAAFASWQRTTAGFRARCLYKAAALMRRRKHEFSAWIVLEAGKSWPEADAETAEAIDFFEFYGRQMERLALPQPLTRIAGEDNELYYIPLGVGVVIPPWNFPLAIAAGMTAAALVAGNTVVLKPASNTQVIAAKLMELLAEAGVPPGVVNYVPGPGGGIGDYLVDHPLTRFVSFTGSREVGLRIYERAARAAPGQRWMKRVVAEMGGKDTIVVDRGCDLELAADSIVASAFGYSGQKCSACSRAVVHTDVYDAVLGAVADRTRKLTVGDPALGGSYTGPVIDAKAQAKILDYIEIGKSEGRLVCGGGKGSPHGYYVEPTVFADVAPSARIAQEEIFGPVVVFLRADSFERAVAIANDTEYGLTGAVISASREHLEYARDRFHVGNLYFNRKCTGALVGVHPFGGFNMSGTDSKAGGSDYLLQFIQAKVVSERL